MYFCNLFIYLFFTYKISYAFHKNYKIYTFMGTDLILYSETFSC